MNRREILWVAIFSLGLAAVVVAALLINQHMRDAQLARDAQAHRAAFERQQQRETAERLKGWREHLQREAYNKAHPEEVAARKAKRRREDEARIAAARLGAEEQRRTADLLHRQELLHTWNPLHEAFALLVGARKRALDDFASGDTMDASRLLSTASGLAKAIVIKGESQLCGTLPGSACRGLQLAASFYETSLDDLVKVVDNGGGPPVGSRRRIRARGPSTRSTPYSAQ